MSVLRKAQELTYSIYRAALLMRREQIRGLQPYHLTPEQWYLLMALATGGRKYTQKELCETFALDAPTLSRMVERMAKHGWVRKESDPSDKRVTLVAATDKGLSFQKTISDQIMSRLTERLGDFSPKEMEDLVELLIKVREGFNEDIRLYLYDN